MIGRLAQMFNRFPGIGPRQARRFVYFLISENSSYVKELVDLIAQLKREARYCRGCFKIVLGKSDKCDLCSDSSRDDSVLMIVAKDIDLENVNRSGEFRGLYFVLGGTLPILEKNPKQKIRIEELKSRMVEMANCGLKEIILALSANTEGDNTVDYLKLTLEQFCEEKNIKISLLGRGLSTGTELEYSDSDTIKNALKNRQ